MPKLMIYGAAGFTGKLATELAVSYGLDFIVAGRTQSTIQRLATQFDISYRVFGLEISSDVTEGLAGVKVLLNYAGPYHRTAGPLIEACIRHGIHYLDAAAELDSYTLSAARHEDARRADVMLLPGCGGSVAMLGCLAGLTNDGVSNPVSVDIALRVSGPMSRGSVVSATENMTSSTLQLQDGELRGLEAGSTAFFDFGDGMGEVSCFGVTLPDLITIHKSTNIPNVRTFVHAQADEGFPTDPTNLPDGPTLEERESNPYNAAVVLTDKEGVAHRSTLRTVNGYSFTAVASVEAARRVLAGEFEAGFQTPAGVFGNDFVKTIAGSEWRRV